MLDSALPRHCGPSVHLTARLGAFLWDSLRSTLEQLNNSGFAIVPALITAVIAVFSGPLAPGAGEARLG